MASPGSAEGFAAAVPGLIEVLGSSAFEAKLFDACRNAFAAKHLAAFATLPSGLAPRIILACNGRCDGTIARAAAERYVKLWERDPVIRAVMNLERGARRDTLIQPTPREFALATYRRGCYPPDDWIAHGSSIVDRATLLRVAPSGMLVVHLYRHRTDGPYRSSELADLELHAPSIFSLIVRQHQRGLRVATPRSIEEMLPQVEAMLPELPSREAQVCAGIALGLSSEGIALALSISVNTVLTYRKRAYSRLGMSSQNELLKLIYPSFSLVADAGTAFGDPAPARVVSP